jgi:hypothetical protein
VSGTATDTAVRFTSQMVLQPAVVVLVFLVGCKFLLVDARQGLITLARS